MESELRGLRAGGGGKLEGICGKGGAETMGGCLWECGMGVVGGGRMWTMDMGMGAGGRGCSLGGWLPRGPAAWDCEGGV